METPTQEEISRCPVVYETRDGAGKIHRTYIITNASQDYRIPRFEGDNVSSTLYKYRGERANIFYTSARNACEKATTENQKNEKKRVESLRRNSHIRVKVCCA